MVKFHFVPIPFNQPVYKYSNKPCEIRRDDVEFCNTEALRFIENETSPTITFKRIFENPTSGDKLLLFSSVSKT